MDPSSIVSLGSLDPEVLITGGIVVGFTTILAGTALLQTYSEHRHWNLLREASVAIIIGMIIGLATFAKALQKVEYDNSSKVFFFILLPIIVFKEGYNLNKQHFMKNFLYVIIYGVFGTIFNFLILAALNYSITNSSIFWLPPQTHPTDSHKDDTPSNSNYAQMFYSACISSKDSAVSLSVLEFEHAPKLHSIIFGEQILNDVIVFALTRTVQDFNKNDSGGEWYATFIFIGTILEQLLVGLLVGVIVGVFATWITKKSRFLSEHSSVVTAFTIYMAYFTFCICEAFDFCGVLAVLICGIMLAHYQSYNLPKISCTSSRITIKALAYVSETVIYFYIGYMVTTTEIVGRNVDSNVDYQVFTFILIQYFVFSPIARVISMALAYGAAILLRMKTKGPWRINRYEFFILFYSGLIKGVVAYALICEQEVGGTDYYKIIQTTSLYMVVGTTLVNGGTLKYICEWAYKRMEDDNLITSRPESELSQMQMRKTFIQEDTKAYKKLNHKSEKMFKTLDENYIKPFLIYNYVERKNDIIIAKKLEKNKHRFEKEQEMKMYDDSVRQQREQFEEHKQKKQQHQDYEPVHVDSGSDDDDDHIDQHQTNSDLHSRNGSNGLSQH